MFGGLFRVIHPHGTKDLVSDCGMIAGCQIFVPRPPLTLPRLPRR
jgi:hypothetical protein